VGHDVLILSWHRIISLSATRTWRKVDLILNGLTVIAFDADHIVADTLCTLGLAGEAAHIQRNLSCSPTDQQHAHVCKACP
jgi:hypothetical protein